MVSLEAGAGCWELAAAKAGQGPLREVAPGYRHPHNKSKTCLEERERLLHHVLAAAKHLEVGGDLAAGRKQEQQRNMSGLRQVARSNTFRLVAILLRHIDGNSRHSTGELVGLNTWQEAVAGTSTADCAGRSMPRLPLRAWHAEGMARCNTCICRRPLPLRSPKHDVEHCGVVAQPQPLIQLQVHLAAVHDLPMRGMDGWIVEAGTVSAGCTTSTTAPSFHSLRGPKFENFLPTLHPAPAPPRRPCGSSGRRRAARGPAAAASARRTCRQQGWAGSVSIACTQRTDMHGSLVQGIIGLLGGLHPLSKSAG